MGVTVISTWDDLARDMKAIPRKSKLGFTRAVRGSVKVGNRVAKASARKNSGGHGKHYPGTFTAEMTGVTEGEYGPDASIVRASRGRKRRGLKQRGRAEGAFQPGGMAPGFEGGSRNQSRPHKNLDSSLPIARQTLYRGVDEALDDCFW